MDLCKNSYYDENEKYYPRLYCSYDNGYCIYSKRCTQVERYIHIENYNVKECYKYIMQEQKNIPKGATYVQMYRPNKKGNLYLYVVINDKVEKISTQLKELEQNYVYLKKDNEGYKVSLTPFVEKKTHNRKPKKNEEE